jgi:hypothetical protein
MKIYAISDLHLDYEKEKPMDIFGECWENHEEKIFENWQKKIMEDDIVLMPGDISWAINIDKAVKDLERIDELKGIKIITKGNHDYWWSTNSKLKKMNLNSITFIQNTSFKHNNIQVFGSRGWIDKTSDDFTEKDLKIFEREIHRLELSLKSGERLEEKYNIVLLHYPPFDNRGNPNEFVDLMEKYNVQTCIYGHLHSEEGHRSVVEGNISGIDFICSSADYINFDPIEIKRCVK